MKLITSLLLALTFILVSYQPTFAQSEITYHVGQVRAIEAEEQVSSPSEQPLFVQTLNIWVPALGEGIVLPYGSEFQALSEAQKMKAGARVIVLRQLTPEGNTEWFLVDVYRLPMLGFLAAGFLVLVVVVSRWRGLAATLGMVLSGVILFSYILPAIVAGQNPLLVSLVGAIGIALSTVYISHSWNFKSHIAVAALVISLVAVAFLAEVSVTTAHLFGLGSEEAYFLLYGGEIQLNLKGLLLGGIILGALGVLDDVVVSQVSVVQQLLAVNKKLSPSELYERSLEVGKDHVASLVNTLVLAYAGANLPLFLLFHLSISAPGWVTINDQVIAEEIVRTLVGSIGLILAVPLSSLIASIVWTRFPHKLTESPLHTHSH